MFEKDTLVTFQNFKTKFPGKEVVSISTLTDGINTNSFKIYFNQPESNNEFSGYAIFWLSDSFVLVPFILKGFLDEDDDDVYQHFLTGKMEMLNEYNYSIFLDLYENYKDLTESFNSVFKFTENEKTNHDLFCHYRNVSSSELAEFLETTPKTIERLRQKNLLDEWIRERLQETSLEEKKKVCI